MACDSVAFCFIRRREHGASQDALKRKTVEREIGFKMKAKKSASESVQTAARMSSATAARMSSAAGLLRAQCLGVVTCGMLGVGVHPDHARFARILFALTASGDAAVQDAIDKAIGIADGTEP